MTPPKPTIGSLQRKIERLEAENEALQQRLNDQEHFYREDLRTKVDLRMRIEQAVRLLQGEDV